MDFTTVFLATLPVYLMMLVGAFARRVGLLPRDADEGIMKLAVHVLFPCLVFERIVNNAALDNPKQLMLAASLGYGLIAFSILSCHAVARLIGMKDGEGARTFGVATGLQNYGYVAIPVVEALFNDKQLVGVLFTFTIGVELAMWTVGVGLLTGMNKAPWRHAINTPVIAIIISLALHFAGAGSHVPPMLHKLLGDLGFCTIPLSVVLVGASIYDLIGIERFRWKVALTSPLLRLGVLPFIFLIVARWLPLSTEVKKIVCVQAAMPSAVFTIFISRHYGGHPATAVLVVLSTTLVSLVATPLLLGFAMKFLGL